MRKCIRCGAEMIDGLDIRDTANAQVPRVTRPGTSGMLPKNFLGEIKASVCPDCGYLEMYVSRLDKIRNTGSTDAGKSK